MNKQFWLSSLAVFVTLSIYGFVVWGMLLPASFYADTGIVWRGEGQENMAWIVISDVLKALVAVWMFRIGYQNKGIAEGVRFGLLAGALFSIPNLVTYAVQPVPLGHTLCMFSINLLSFVLAGAVLAWVYGATAARV
jgi:hypothetical protein